MHKTFSLASSERYRIKTKDGVILSNKFTTKEGAKKWLDDHKSDNKLQGAKVWKVGTQRTFSSNDNEGQKQFSVEDNLKQLAKKLATFGTDYLEQIDEKQWEKFDKMHEGIQKGYQNIANGLLGWEHITDANIKSFVLDRADDIYRASGTEKSVLEQYMEDLIKFVSSKGQRTFSDGPISVDNDPTILQDEKDKKITDSALNSAKPKDTVINFDNGKPFFMSVEPWLATEVVNDVNDGIYAGTIKGSDISAGDKIINLAIKLNSEYPDDIISVVKGKKVYVWKLKELIRHDSAKVFSIAQELDTEKHEIQDGPVGEATEEIEKEFSEDAKIYEAHILPMKEGEEYHADAEYFGPATKAELMEALTRAKEAAKSNNANPPAEGVYFYTPVHIGFFETKEEARKAAEESAEDWVESRSYCKQFSVSSDTEFIEACHKMAKDVLGDAYSEEITEKTAKGILDDQEGDYDVKLGMFRNSIKSFSKNFSAKKYTVGLVPESKRKEGSHQGMNEEFYNTSDIVHRKTFLVSDDVESKVNEWKSKLESTDKVKYILTELDPKESNGDKDNWIHISGFSKAFSAYQPVEYGFEIKPGDMVYDMDHVIGSLLFSVTYSHLYHLIISSYASHIALDEFYNEMPEKVDALAEAYLAETNLAKFVCCVTPTTADPIDYLESLKKFLDEYPEQKQGELKNNFQSLLDDCVNLIESTLYKLKRLHDGNKNFSFGLVSKSKKVLKDLSTGYLADLAYELIENPDDLKLAFKGYNGKDVKDLKNYLAKFKITPVDFIMAMATIVQFRTK
jgi:hypothetical protein